MKSGTIRGLHNRTGALVRAAVDHGEIQMRDSGQIVAKILPQSETVKVPFFARRKMSAAFKRLDESGKTGKGMNSTDAISDDREDRT